MIGNGPLKARLGELARSRQTAREPEPPDGSAGDERLAPASGRESGGDAANARGSREPGRRSEPRLELGSAGSGAERSRSSPPGSLPEAAPGEAPLGVEMFLSGGEWRDERGAVYVHERLRSEIERRRPHWGRLGAAPEQEPDLAALCVLGLEHALFLDLETGGLSSSPVFLAGTMHWNGSDFVLRQYFARHYGEEATLLAALALQARDFEFLVTFNGKSYDVPFLRDRALVHRVPLVVPPRHLDLLHPARRRWKGTLPDCRLQTLEYRVCRRRRVGDVPGEEVPGLYHDYVRNGDPYRLVPVFHHNLLDVITMGELLGALCR